MVQPAMELGAKKAHFKLDGEVLDDKASKHVLRDSAWAYRLAGAFGDPALREPMLREGFSRLETIRQREVTLNVDAEGSNAPREIGTTIGAGTTLRRHAVKFVSEWGLRDVEAAVEASPDYRAADVAEIERLQWWDDAVAAGVDLPEDRAVWHYHPVAALEALIAQEPRFFVERNGQKLFYSYPSELEENGSIRDNLQSGETVRIFPESTSSQPVLGVGHKHPSFYDDVGIGLAEVDYKNRLYDVLIREKVTEGIPKLSARDKRIWASLWSSEGGLYANNTWDIGMLSFGPFQQTAGKPHQRGELQAALAHVRDENEELYRHYFGRYGLDVVDCETQSGIVKGHFSLQGETLITKAEKWKLRSFVWTHRATEAMHDPEFRLLFLEHGFTRLDIVRSLQSEIHGVHINLEDVICTELGQALVLDAHINIPSNIESVWADAVEEALEVEQLKNPTSIRRNEELKILSHLLSERRTCGMHDPDRRAAYIILCSANLDDELASSLGYNDVSEIEAAASEGYRYDFLQTNQ